MKKLQFLTKSIIVLFVTLLVQTNSLHASPISVCPPDTLAESDTINIPDTIEDQICSPTFPVMYMGTPVDLFKGKAFIAIKAADGTDSLIVRLKVFSNTPDTIRMAACADDFPLTYDSLSFTTATTQTISYDLDTNGCPALHHFIITQYPVYQDTVHANVCVVDTPFTFHDTTFYESGVFNFHDTTAYGCDSNTVLILQFHPVYEIRDTISATICSHDLPYVYGDSSFTASGTYDIVQNTSFGCDSALVHLTLTVTDNLYDTLTFNVCHNDFPVMIDSLHSYDSAGTYYIMHDDTLPCHDITTVIINDLPFYNDTIQVNWCSADGPFLFADSNFTASTIFTHTDTTLLGCDSLTTLVLNYGESYADTLFDTLAICRYDLPYVFADSSITEAGDYVFDFTTAIGCDSLHLNLTVVVNDYPQDTMKIYVCENDFPYAYGDSLIPTPGTYLIHIPDTVTFGCDTMRQLIVDSLPIYHDSLNVSVCANVPYMVGDSAITVPGTYDILLQSAQGCDSLVTVTLNHYPIYDQDTLNFTTCENDLPFVYGDTSFTEAGQHRIRYASEFGCDSMVTINLNIVPIIYNTDTIYESICHSQLPYTTSFGKTVTHAGLHSFVTTSVVTGCDSVYYYFLTVYANPTPSISGQSHLCTGTSTNLSATAGMVAYSWNNGNSNQLIEIDNPGTYTVTVTDNHGCTGSATKTVTEAALPDIQLSNTQTICKGNTATISVSGADHYVWENGNTNSSITVEPATTTAYHVTAYSALACQREGYVTVVVNELPNATISGPSEICQNETAIFEADGGLSYRWSTGATSSNITLTAGGKYTVTVTDANNCSDTASRRLTVNALPSISINGITPFCQGQSTMLTANGAISYSWSTADTTRSISTTYAGTYTVTGTDAHGCKSSASKTVSIHEITAVLTGNNYFCHNQSTTLSVSGNESYSYRWANGSSASSLTVNAAGTYTVTVTNAMGCSLTMSQTVQENPLPTPSITGPSTICQGRANANLVAEGGVSYIWSNGSSSAYIPIVTTGTYYVTVTDQNGCSASTSRTVIVNPQPTVNITARTNICQNESVAIYATTDAEGATYNWTTTGQTTPFINVTPMWSPSVYTVRVTDENGCSNSASITINVQSNPTVYLSGPTSICQGDTATYSALGGISYLWNNGMATNTINVTRPGQYTVTVSNAYGCTATSSATLAVNPIPTIILSNDTSICQGGSATLMAYASGCNYHWSNNATTSSITVNQAGTYYVTATNYTTGCSNVASVTVTMNAKPTVSIAGSTTFCEGGSTTLTANTDAFNTYSWNTGVSNTPLNVTSAGTYTITVTNANGCTQTASTTVSMYNKPTPSITGASTICPGSTAQLTAGIQSHYQWSTGDTTQTISVSPTTTTTYTLTVSDIHGCQNQTSTLVSIGAIPSIQISGDLAFCENSSTQLTASPGYSYIWSNNSSSQSITVNQPGTYRVTATNSLGCSTTDSAVVTTLPLPHVDFGMQHTICQGQSYTYQLPGNSPLTYHWANGSSSNVLTVSTAGTYTVTVTNEHGCSITAADTLRVVDLPTPAIQGTSSICRGNSAILSAIGGGSYLWSNGSTAADIVVSPTATTTYTVTASNQYGCSATASTTITVNTLPSLNISGDRYFCQGGNTTLTASGASSYSWSTGSNSNMITISTPGTYFVTASNSMNCQRTDSVVIVRQENPTITISGDNLICEGATNLLSATGANTYAWNNGENNASILVSPTETSIYTVTGTNAWGCSSSVSKVVNVEAAPVVHITGNTTICQGENTILTATGGSYYMWSTGSSNNQINATTAGIYSVTGTSLHGCTGSASATLTVNVLPQITISGPTSLCENTTAVLTANGGATYVWSDGSTSNSLSIDNSGNYSVTATNIYGCSSSATHSVSLLAAPQLSISGVTSLCQGSSTTLQAISNALTYNWSNGENTQTISISPMVSTGYAVTATNLAGCTNTDSIFVVVNQPYQVTFSDTICQGATYVRHGFELPAQNEYGDHIYYNYLQSVAGCDSTIVLLLYVKPLPILPDAITGNSQISNHGQYTYSVDNAQYANSYEWRVSKPQWTLSSSNSNVVYLDIEQNGTGTLTAMAINSCGTSELSISIYCNVGIDEYTNETNIVVYPVPTRDVLNINLEDAAANVRKIQLIDQRGRCLQNVNVDDFHMQLDCSSCAAGHYFVRFIDENGKTIDTRKIVVNR